MQMPTAHFWPHALSPQVIGELIGSGVKLGVCQTPVFTSQRNVVRRTLGLFLEQLMNALAFRIAGLGIVELDQ